jgi:FkbM family methyltransferase
MSALTKHETSYQLKSVDGVTFELDLREAIDKEIFDNNYFEGETAVAISRLCRPGYVVFDIGANIGAHTFHLAKYAGATGSVIAFEPTSYAYTRLYRNMLLNPFSNIRLEKMALSDVSGTQELHFMASWPVDGKYPTPEYETMYLMTMDEYVRRFQIPRVDLIKLDVDGYEFKILKGGKDTIQAYKPSIILGLADYVLARHGNSVMELLQLLALWGYRFHSEKTYEELRDLSAIVASIPSGCSINVIALRPF